MKKIILAFVFLISSISGFSQNFEGTITYTISYKSKNPQVTDQQWTSMIGSSQEYYIKEGDYKSVTNGTLFQWQLYLNKDNKLYNKMANSETAFWNDCSIQGDEIINAVVNKNATEILGYQCDEVILTCKSGIQKYYFNSKLSVNTKLFSNHKLGNWFDYLTYSNALPLKSIIENAQFTLESVASTIKPIQLDNNLFELPIGIKTEKSPY